MSADPKPLGVFILAVDPLVRSALSARLSGDPTLALRGEGRRVSEASALMGQDVDVLLWDAGPSTWDGAEPLSESLPPALALVAHSEAAKDAIRLGAAGVLSRESEQPVLKAALYAVSEGLFVSEREWAPTSAEISPAPESAAELREPLTARERGVLQWMARGLPNKGIALKLGISDHTAKFHVNAILQKLGAERRTEAVVRAARLGLVVL